MPDPAPTAARSSTSPPDLPVMASPPAVPAGDPSYIVEVGGKRISQFGSLTAALSAGLTLKGQNAGAEVKVYDVRERATA